MKLFEWQRFYITDIMFLMELFDATNINLLNERLISVSGYILSIMVNAGEVLHYI